jgi:hypothetical protein
VPSAVCRETVGPWTSEKRREYGRGGRRREMPFPNRSFDCGDFPTGLRSVVLLQENGSLATGGRPTPKQCSVARLRARGQPHGPVFPAPGVVVARSPKPVRPCNPRLGRFDSGAAPSYFVAANQPHRSSLVGADLASSFGRDPRTPAPRAPRTIAQRSRRRCLKPLSRALCAEMAIRRAESEAGARRPRTPPTDRARSLPYASVDDPRSHPAGSPPSYFGGPAKIG